jgi:Putative transposase of IS4/5 family (DUF4096)
MSVRRLAYTTDLTDEEWQLLAPILPSEKPGGRPRQYPMWVVLNDIEYGLCGGTWRLMPHDLPPWQTAAMMGRRNSMAASSISSLGRVVSCGMSWATPSI